jgi:hypothetical protein
MKAFWQYLLCVLLILSNLWYIWFYLREMDGVMGFLSELWPLNWFIFNGLFMILFPIFNFVLLINRKYITWVDYSLIFIPILLWWWLVLGQYFVPGFVGFCGNFLVISPAMIGTVSCLYLLRFVKPLRTNQTPRLLKKVLLLWLVIFLIVSFLHIIIPPL